ncbi:50S ribosomal protein L1 [Striga asiatica]|uniref:50S ribosomal protein L1 n=1 Tax=Striga asiatica TaxID=4170 RepID=A0A5A7P995_STRAF|nr:50S ribosomal protein L1 [Striga asiatica]
MLLNSCIRTMRADKKFNTKQRGHLTDNTYFTNHGKLDDIDFAEEDEKIKVWVQILYLSLHKIIAEIGLKIEKLFGKLQGMVSPKNGSSNRKIVKILVHLKLNKPILKETQIRLGTENKWVKLKYENIQKKKKKRKRCRVWLRTSSGLSSDDRNDSSSPSDSQHSVNDFKKCLPNTSMEKNFKKAILSSTS